MTFPPLLRFSYWFNASPPPFAPVVDIALPIFFAVLLVAGIAAGIVAPRRKWEKMTRRLVERCGYMLTVLGVFGLVLYALSFERVPVLSARLGFLVWAGFVVYYAWQTYRFVRVEMPAVQKRREERERLEKWMPKNNK
jgi:Ca2+/Na+ antiporter